MHTEGVESPTIMHKSASGTVVYTATAASYPAASGLDSYCPCKP